MTASTTVTERIPRKEQYEALARFYTEEAERYEALNKRALAYLSIIGALSIFAVFKLDAISAKVLASPVTLTLGFLAGTCTLAAIVVIAWSMRVLDYLTIADPREIVLQVDADNYSTEDTYSVLLVGLVEAVAQNRELNDRRASTLSVALWFAVAAALLFGATNAMILSLTR
jgi:hypothetical protein